ncbi:exosome complex component CSL4 isoform X1 [Hemibagrus wyckioides]|nr:exosome complex component CSL4 isoform X1 [Hemibagrus wyckioides]
MVNDKKVALWFIFSPQQKWRPERSMFPLSTNQKSASRCAYQPISASRTLLENMSPMKLCVPGERLCSVEDCISGAGTYQRHGSIFASLAGYVIRRNEGEELPMISVVKETEAQLLPDVGAIVTCKVTSINPRFAKVHILYVGSTPLKDRFRGTIRKEDVRATEKDKVETYKSFRPGDIVLAKVISLGDVQSNYLLTTAENELGVVVAHSEAGVQMVPISWCEMQCPRTHNKEFRKVARVQPEYLQA